MMYNITDFLFSFIECGLFVWFSSTLLIMKDGMRKPILITIALFYATAVYLMSISLSFSFLKFPSVVVMGLLIVMVLSNDSWVKKVTVPILFFIVLIISELIIISIMGLVIDSNITSLLMEDLLFTIILFVISKLLILAILNFLLKVLKRSKISNQNYYVVIVNILSILIMVMIAEIAVKTDYYHTSSITILLSILGIVCINILLFIIVSKLTRLHEEEKERIVQVLRSEMLVEHYVEERKKNTEVRGLIHDFNNHVDVLYQLIGNDDTKAKEYIDELYESKVEYNHFVKIDNGLLDIILNKKLDMMRKEKIKYKVNIDQDITYKISQKDLVSLMTNLLDNAIEASLREVESQREVIINLMKYEEFLLFSVSNYCSSNPLLNGRPRGTKKSNKLQHGQGVKIVNNIVKNNNGSIEFLFKSNFFVAQVLL